MSGLTNLEAFETALAALKAAFARQLADDAETIQSLLRDGRSLERHDITTDEPGALSFAAMMADRDDLRAQLAKVTAQRDEARAAAETLRDEACHPTDPENPRRTLPWEVG